MATRRVLLRVCFTPNAAKLKPAGHQTSKDHPRRGSSTNVRLNGGMNLRPAISIRTRLRSGVEEGALYPLPLGRTGDTSTLSEYAIMAEICRHLNQVRRVHPSGNGCRECLETGDAWVHLRLCLTCGHVGCCDDSKNRHATKHFHATHHPIIQSFEPGEDWRWCYVDEMMV